MHEAMNTNENIAPEVQKAIEKYQFDVLPVEGTFYKSTYCSKEMTPDGHPMGTAMIGMYCEHPRSLSTFHRLTHDEVWHMYEGDPFELILLHPDGTGEHRKMGGPDGLIQTVIPAGTYQAGRLLPGGTYAIYGTTMAPGFDVSCFEAGISEELLAKYPSFAEEIRELGNPKQQRYMPQLDDKK